MKTPYYALALSVAVLAIATQPAHAQMRRSSPRATAAAAPDTVDAAGAGPLESPTSTALPRLELKMFIGPAFEGGNKGVSLTRSQTTTTTNTTTSGTTTTTTSNSTPTVNNTSGFGNGFGVMYGVDGTWWGSPRLGLGLGVFGAYLGAGQTNTIQHLQGQQPSAYLGNVSGSQTTTVSESDTLTGNPLIPGAPSFGATITPAAAPGSGNTTVTTSFTGFTLPGGGTFTLSSGQTAAANPNTSSTSTGGASYTYNRTFFLDDITLHGDYMLVDTPAGGVSFFGGFTLPTGFEHRNLTAKTVDKNGQTGTASQTSTTTTTAAGDTSYTTKTDYNLNESYTADASMLALGPVFGLNAFYNVGTNVRLFSQVGYAPVLVGQSTITESLTRNNSTTVTVTQTGTPAGAPAAGTTTTTANTATSTQTFGSFSGAEALGTIGAGFNVGGINLFLDGTARDYTLSGQEIVFGANVGAAWGF